MWGRVWEAGRVTQQRLAWPVLQTSLRMLISVLRRDYVFFLKNCPPPRLDLLPTRDGNKSEEKVKGWNKVMAVSQK